MKGERAFAGVLIILVAVCTFVIITQIEALLQNNPATTALDASIRTSAGNAAKEHACEPADNASLTIQKRETILGLIPVSCVKEYTVRRGDCYIKIAKRFNVTVPFLKKLNNRTSNALTAGEKIIIVQGPFHARVREAALTLVLTLEGEIIKAYPIGMGGETPAPGTYTLSGKKADIVQFGANIINATGNTLIIGTRIGAGMSMRTADVGELALFLRLKASGLEIK